MGLFLLEVLFKSWSFIASFHSLSFLYITRDRITRDSRTHMGKCGSCWESCLLVKKAIVLHAFIIYWELSTT